ncbi:hypothetical protein JCM12681A_20680 [Streptomyces mexicanus]
MGEAGRALVGGLHGELGGDADAFPGPRLQVQAVRLLTTAPETRAVVRAEEFTGRGGVGVPYRLDGVGGRLKACGTTTHRRRPYPRGGPSRAPCQASCMQLPAQPYEERLTAPRSWWLISFLIGVSCALVLLPFGVLPMLGGLVGGTAVAAIVASSYGSVRIRVVGDCLIAGEAKVPVTALGEAEILDAEEARAWRTYKADTRAFLLLRAYIPTALRVEVTDPQDPTPYLYLSTRDPQGLLEALRAARAATASDAA